MESAQPELDGGFNNGLGLVTLLVDDYDRALSFFVGALGFELVEDRTVDDQKRWVVVRPGGAQGTGLLLARAANTDQKARIGNQTGGRVAFFLYTNDVSRDYERLTAAGIAFEGALREELYGIVTVFRDLYGNRWDLIQPL